MRREGNQIGRGLIGTLINVNGVQEERYGKVALSWKLM